MTDLPNPHFHANQGDNTGALRHRIAALEAENVELRKIVSDSLAALGTSSGCTPEASLEFMRFVPDEIRETLIALREALAAPVVPPGYALVPVAALKWLHGEEGVFECPPEGYFRGRPAPYWWRKVFHKMCAAPQPKEQTT